MAVNKKNLIYILIFFGIQMLSAEVLLVDDSVNVFVEKKLKQSLEQWGEQIKTCQQKEEQSPLSLETTSLKDLNISISEFQTAVMTLNYNNFSRCTQETKNAYILQSLLVYKMHQEKGKDASTALNFVLADLPSSEVLEAFIKYEKLSPKVKSYFEKNIGLEPFNIVKVSLPILKFFRK